MTGSEKITRVFTRVPSRLTAVNSRAPCLGADQKARGLWERDWPRGGLSANGKEEKTHRMIIKFI